MGLWRATVIGAMGSLGAGRMGLWRATVIGAMGWLGWLGTGWEREKPSRERELSNDQSRARGWLGEAGGVAGDGEEVRAESEEVRAERRE
uniref:Uncharacterized protein n=1 Tax=Fagus sylvatica TaxID=28930 RepID=A0A2N9IDT6_FAGSY